MQSANAYTKLHERYSSLAATGIDYDTFVSRLLDDGVSGIYVAKMLRDFFDATLEECIRIRLHVDAYSNAELKKLPLPDTPSRGIYCPQCTVYIPLFKTLTRDLESELLSVTDMSERVRKIIALTGCPERWATIWAFHPNGPHRKLGHDDAPNCPHCGNQLRTRLAQQCLSCGADWHQDRC